MPMYICTDCNRNDSDATPCFSFVDLIDGVATVPDGCLYGSGKAVWKEVQ